MKKGAFVELVSGMGAAMPNVVIFQFNPETMRHAWSQGPATSAPRTGSSPLAVAGAPGESFSFSLAMDVTDHITVGDAAAHEATSRHGLYARLAALELLLHPSPLAALAGSARTTPTAQLPTVLFVWGAKRIVPVRVTSLTITEKLYDADLNPTHAEAQIELRVLTADDLRAVRGAAGALATAAYRYTAGQRVALAASNLGGSARDVIGLLAEKNLVP